MWNKLIKEVNENRVAGPFTDIPFQNFMQSPIGLVPKDNGKKTRLIFHLSYQFKDGLGSLNANTPKQICSVTYNDLDHAVNNCLNLLHEMESDREKGGRWSSPPVIYFGKTDVQSTFCILGLNRRSWAWLIMKAKDPISGIVKYFVDKCLPFGASISCALFQAFSDALRHIFETLEKIRNRTTNYLDDFLFMALSRMLCNALISRFLDLCAHLNVPMSQEKTVWASTQVIFLGIMLDGKFYLLIVPEEKRNHAISLLERFLSKKKATVGELQSLCGFLNFLNHAIFAGRTFTRRMYSKYSAVLLKAKDQESADPSKTILQKHHHVRLDAEFKLDCRVWLEFLNSDQTAVVNRPMVDLSKTETSEILNFYSDSSANPKLGFGCIFKNEWIFEQWEPEFIVTNSPSIKYLELFGLCAGVFTWENQLKNRRITVFCDNQSVMEMVNSGVSTCKNCMFLLRMFTLNNLQFNR